MRLLGWIAAILLALVAAILILGGRSEPALPDEPQNSHLPLPAQPAELATRLDSRGNPAPTASPPSSDQIRIQVVDPFELTVSGAKVVLTWGNGRAANRMSGPDGCCDFAMPAVPFEIEIRHLHWFAYQRCRPDPIARLERVQLQRDSDLVFILQSADTPQVDRVSETDTGQTDLPRLGTLDVSFPNQAHLPVLQPTLKITSRSTRSAPALRSQLVTTWLRENPEPPPDDTPIRLNVALIGGGSIQLERTYAQLFAGPVALSVPATGNLDARIAPVAGREVEGEVRVTPCDVGENPLPSRWLLHGSVRFPRVPVGHQYEVVLISHELVAARARIAGPTRAGATVVAQLEWGDVARISARLVDGQNQPLTECQAGFVEHGQNRPRKEQRSDPSGRVLFLVAPGTALTRIMTVRRTSIRLQLPELLTAGSYDLGDLQFSTPTRVAQGELVDTAGQPIRLPWSGVVEASQGSWKVVIDGARFQVFGTPLADLQLTVVMRNPLVHFRAPLARDGTYQRITVPDLCILRGRIGGPIGAAERIMIVVEPDQPGLVQGNAEGPLSFANQRDLRYQLQILSGNYRLLVTDADTDCPLTSTRTVSIQQDMALDLEIPKPRTIRLRVVHASATPVLESVEVRYLDSGLTRTTEAGEIVLQIPPEGTPLQLSCAGKQMALGSPTTDLTVQWPH